MPKPKLSPYVRVSDVVDRMRGDVRMLERRIEELEDAIRAAVIELNGIDELLEDEKWTPADLIRLGAQYRGEDPEVQDDRVRELFQKSGR